MGRVFPDLALQKSKEQGFDRFQTINLLAKRAKAKARKVQGVKYLTDAERAWCKRQNKFTVQAIKELESGELNLNDYVKELTETVEEDTLTTPPKEIKDIKKEE